VGASYLVIIRTSAQELMTEGWRSHSSRCGDVLSSWAPTTPGMVLQCSGWQYSGGDGLTGPELAEGTRSTSPTSQHRLVRARGRRPYPFRGFRRPLSRGAACRLYGSGRHSVTKLTPAFRHSSPAVLGMAAWGGLAEQRRDMIPRRCQRAGVMRIHFWPRHPHCTRAFNALVGGVGAGATSSRRRFARGGIRPSGEAEIRPRGRPALERGGDFAVLRPTLKRGGSSLEGH
jgi:hypothetical protein